MASIIAYVSSDHHVPDDAEGLTWKDVPGVSGDALFVLSQVVALCVRDHVPLVAAGDLIDGPDMSPDALAGWFNVLRPLTVAELPLFYCLGNHERNRDWLLAFGPTAVRLDGRTITLPSGVTLSGLSFVPPTTFAAQAAQQGRLADIGVYHQAVGDFGVKGLPLSQFPPHRLAIIGDTHTPMVIEDRGPRRALSPGPLCPQSVSEFHSRVPGVWAVTADLDVRHVKVPSRVYHRFDVDSPAAADACVAAVAALIPDSTLPEHMQRPMIAVRTTVDLDGFVPALRELVGRQGLPLRVLDSTGIQGGTGITSADASADKVSADFVSVVANWPGLTPGARALAIALADPAVDPGEALDADRATWEASPDEADVFEQTD